MNAPKPYKLPERLYVDTMGTIRNENYAIVAGVGRITAAQRMVATWNACAGIPTDALEAGALREALVKAYQVVNYKYFHVHKGTSTEAIAAFEKLGIKGPAMDPEEIRAALAKVRP